MKIEKMITELDTAAGMILVGAMKDPVILQAMGKINNVSIELGELAGRIDSLDTDENLFD